MAVERRIDGEQRPAPPETESLSGLLRQFADESGDLVRHEINLAKLELKETASHIAMNAAAIAIWVGVAAVGGLALTAFLILVVGLLLGGAYWASALIVGLLYVVTGGLMARRAAKRIGETDLRPDETIRSVKENRRWLGREAQDMRRRLVS